MEGRFKSGKNIWWTGKNTLFNLISFFYTYKLWPLYSDVPCASAFGPDCAFPPHHTSQHISVPFTILFLENTVSVVLLCCWLVSSIV